MKAPATLLFLIAAATAILALPGCYQPAEPPENPVAAWLVQLLPENPAASRQALLKNLSSPDADKRRQGVEQLPTEIPDRPDLVAEILTIMATGDTDPAVRAAALRQYAALDQPDKLPDLLKQTAADPSPLVRSEAVLLLAHQPDDLRLEPLTTLLRNDPDPAVRSHAAHALADCRRPEALDALLDALYDRAFRVQYRAREALVQLTGKDFGYDAPAWKAFLAETPQPLADPQS